jgi:hypothetical protein
MVCRGPTLGPNSKESSMALVDIESEFSEAERAVRDQAHK